MIQELLKKGKGDLAARVAVSAVLQGRFFCIFPNASSSTAWVTAKLKPIKIWWSMSTLQVYA